MARPRRIPGYPYLGVQRYFITACTRDRLPYFTDPDVVRLVVDAFVQTAREHAITIVVYCVMPDHFHLAVWPRGDGDLGRWMHGLLNAQVRRYHQQHGTSGQPFKPTSQKAQSMVATKAPTCA